MIITSYAEFEKKIKANEIRNGVVIICGQEKKLADASVKAVYNIVGSFPELNITVIDGEGISVDSVSNACETLPFLSEYKIVHIKNPSFLTKQSKENDDDSKAKKPKANSDLVPYIIDFSEKKAEGTILLITADGDIDERGKLAASVKKNGYLVQYNALKGDELYKWVNHYFEKSGKHINKTEITYLVSVAGGTTQQLDKEIVKLCDYAADCDVILKEHIDAVVHKNLESNIFKMIDSITRKDTNGAVVMLYNLLSQKEKHLSILAMIIRQYRLMLLANGYQKQGLQTDMIGEKLKLKGYPLSNMLKQSRNYSDMSLKTGLEKCLDTDYKIKKGVFSTDELDLSLELLLIELCR